MKTLEFKWTISRGRDTYGYNVCTLYADGKKVSRCNGGGYDMEGTCLGDYIARAFADRLRELKPEDMPANSHWERADNPRRLCEDITCRVNNDEVGVFLSPQTLTCPHCGKPTQPDYHEGRRVDDGRYFYGLTFHDPNFDPGKAVICKDCSDRTFSGKSDGKTVEQAEKDGDTVGLERYQAFYSASSKQPTQRHTVPLIDGACGKSSVERIANAIGLTLEYVPTRSKNLSIYQLHDNRSQLKAVA